MKISRYLKRKKNDKTSDIYGKNRDRMDYENREWAYGYRETDPMNGYDPYSSSKGCAELVTATYRALAQSCSLEVRCE